MKLLWMGLLLLGLGSAWAGGIEVREFASPDQEARYKELIEELRCTVCQNQNIAESNAELAQDLRSKTYKMVQQGKSNQEIKDYMVDRYGSFVLYSPPKRGFNWILWIAPFGFLALGAWVILVRIRENRNAPATQVDSQSEAERLAEVERLLKGGPDPDQQDDDNERDPK